MKGFAAFYIIFIFAIVLIGGILLKNNFNSYDVLGDSDEKTSVEEPGVLFYVSSKSTAWDMLLYVCKSKEECLKSADSGKKITTISGGEAMLKEVSFKYLKEWDNYNYMKVFVKPSWSNNGLYYHIASLGGVPESSIEKFKIAGKNVDTILLPLREISSNELKSAIFTDH